MLSDDDVRRLYGRHAVVSRAGDYVLVHLDNPDPDVVTRRTADFDPDEYFDSACPLCQIQRARRVIVFDDYPDEEEILLE